MSVRCLTTYNHSVHYTSGYNDTRLTTEGRKIVDTKSVLKPCVHVFKVPHNIQPQCTLYSTHTPIDHEPASLDDTDTHNTRTQVPAKCSGSHEIRHASIAAFARTKDPLLNTTSLTRTQTPAVVRIRITLHSSSQVLKPLAIGNAASQLAKHKRLSLAATMSDATPSSLTPFLHCASILQQAAPPQVVAFES